MSETFQVGQAVRFIGGRYNGLVGNIAKLCDRVASVLIERDGQYFEEVEETRHLTDLRQWQESRSTVERSLRGDVAP